MAQWAVVISDERYEAERLFHHDTLDMAAVDGAEHLALGDELLVLAVGRSWDASAEKSAPAEEPHPMVVALGQVRQSPAGPLVISYTHRVFDEPQPADQLALDGVLTRLDPAAYRAVAGRFAPPADNTTWLVSLDLPIEANSPAEAVRQFWTYVMQLGPRELPAFVWPAGDELAMQAFVLGDEANLDPEEE
jgi:hypothetical protein